MNKKEEKKRIGKRKEGWHQVEPQPNKAYWLFEGPTITTLGALDIHAYHKADPPKHNKREAHPKHSRYRI